MVLTKQYVFICHICTTCFNLCTIAKYQLFMFYEMNTMTDGLIIYIQHNREKLFSYCIIKHNRSFTALGNLL